jgi:two-component system, cell cycle response regulator DivK
MGSSRPLCLPPLVFVVDDYEETRELYAIELARAGYRIEGASNGQEALEKVFVVNPAVVVMDLSMPVLDGWEATRRIKADPRAAGIVIIAVTGHATNFGIQQARDAGAHVVVRKPCAVEDLLALIKRLTGPIDEGGR